MMGLKKPVFQPSTTPSFHAAYQENATKSVVIPINCRNFDTLAVRLSEAFNQAVKIIIAVKFDFNFAFLPVFSNHDLGAEVTGEVFSEACKMYLLGSIFGFPGFYLLRFQAFD
jgi:hypothetical protein